MVGIFINHDVLTRRYLRASSWTLMCYTGRESMIRALIQARCNLVFSFDLPVLSGVFRSVGFQSLVPSAVFRLGSERAVRSKRGRQQASSSNEYFCPGILAANTKGEHLPTTRPPTKELLYTRSGSFPRTKATL